MALVPIDGRWINPAHVTCLSDLKTVPASTKIDFVSGLYVKARVKIGDVVNLLNGAR